MSKSRPNREGTRNPNKGYPRRVIEKYGSMLRPDNADEASRVANATDGLSNSLHMKNPAADAAREVATETQDNSATPDSAGTETAMAGGHRDGLPVNPENQASPAPDSPGPSEATETTTMEASPSTEKGDRRAEPQTPWEFVEAFFSGKTKTLSSANIKRMIGASDAIEPAVRGHLLRRVQEVDPSLEKTRKLMLLARENRAYRTLSHLLMEFCVECVLLNPAVRAAGMKAMLFPGFDDETSLEEAWRLLQSLNVSGPAVLDNTTQPENIPGIEATAQPTVALDDQINVTRQSKEGKDRTSGPKVAASRSRRNALLCSAIWRMHHDQTTFAETMRSLRATVFALRERPQSLESALFEAIATLPDKEDERVAYVLEWSARQQADGMNKLAEATRQAEALQSRIAAAEKQLQTTVERTEMLERHLEAERTARAAADKAVGVAQTHGQADLEEVRAMSLRAIKDAIAQLDVVSAALKRESPKVDSARDKVDSVMDALKNTNKKLEDA